MAKYLYAALLLLTILTACKKENKPHTSMTVVVNGDSTWTTNSVSTYPTGTDAVTLSATDPVTHDRIMLAMSDYREGRKTYEIDYRGTGVNMNGNLAEYEHGSKVDMASTGSISITKFNVRTIEGTFDFSSATGHISGTFIAIKP